MDLGFALHSIWRRKIWLVPVVIAALLAAILATFKVSLVPPSIESGSFEFGSASTEVLVDSERSSLATLEIPVEALSERASVYASLMRSGAVRRRIGRAIGVPRQAISVEGTALEGAEGNAAEPTAAERAGEIVADREMRNVFFRVTEGQPIIQISTQANAVGEAVALADAAAVAISDYIEDLQKVQGIDGPSRVDLNQIGGARGGLVGGSADLAIGALAGLAVFLVGIVAILLVPRVVEDVRRAEDREYLDLIDPHSGLDSEREIVSSNGLAEASTPSQRPARTE